MLSNFDVDDLVFKMGIPNFKGCYYKDLLKKVIKRMLKILLLERL